MKYHFLTETGFFKKTWFLGFLAWMILFFPVTILALEPGSPILNIMGGKVFEAEIEEADPRGKVEETHSGISVTVPLRLNTGSRLKVKFSYEQTSYDWADSGRITFSRGYEPWDKLCSADMNLSYVHNWSRSWSGLAGVSIGAAWEDQLEDAYSFGGHVGALYRTDSNVSWLIGAGVLQRPEDTLFYPIIGATWNHGDPGEHQAGWSAALGVPKTEIRYSFNEVLDAYCNIKMDMTTYRLKEDSKASPSGLAEMTRFTSGLFLDIHPIEPLRISVGVMYLFDREWEIQDENGDAIRTVDIDGGVGAGAVLSWTF
ncbi:DUF6268 family outer membrane beta-barrel protein [Desulfobacterales bacterium HSG2]|nr:DUF6268 family outer membrane beta-barrel protein [Desulfobacterales bacterium HSG2]